MSSAVKKYHVQDNGGTPRSDIDTGDTAAARASPEGFTDAAVTLPHIPIASPSAMALPVLSPSSPASPNSSLAHSSPLKSKKKFPYPEHIQMDLVERERVGAGQGQSSPFNGASDPHPLSAYSPKEPAHRHLSIPITSHEASNNGTSEASKYINQISQNGLVGVSMHIRASEDDRPTSPKSTNGGGSPPAFVRRTSTMLPHPTLMGPNEISKQSDVFTPPGMLRPNSTFLLIWSYVIMVISIYNTVTIPYRMAFWTDPIIMEPDVIFMLTVDSLSDVCFFIHMYLNLRTGFIEAGVIVFDKDKIWKKYLSSWFILDLITCLPFDLVQLGFLKVIPVVRALKIGRLFQVLHHYNIIEENTSVTLQFRIGKLLFYTGILSHFASCIKYHVMLTSHTGTPIHDSLVLRSQFGKYLQAMYWATGAMIGRDDTNPPENLVDAGFTVLMMVFGILWLAYIIASLETFAHDGNTSSARFQAKLGYVSQFMYQFQIPKEIQDKVKAYYSYLWSSTLRFETEHFLETLPATLQSDVNLSLHQVIERSQIFADVDSGFLAFVVHTITTIVSIPGEIICQYELAGNEMYFISEGEVEICIGPKLAAIATLRPGDYFGEYAIFLSTTRTATARSVSYCTLLVLTGENLLKALSLFPHSDMLVRQHVEEHRNKTAGQERNFFGLDAGGSEEDAKSGKKKKNANAKLQKLIQVDTQVQNRQSDVWTISPTSKFFERWQAVYFFFMAWNAIVLPVRFGFAPDEVNGVVMFIDYLGDMFLIADILLNFRVRFIQGGGEISDTKQIRDRYLRGWFIVHVLSSIPLDFIMITAGMQPLYRLNRILRLSHVHVAMLDKLKDSAHYEIASLSYLIFTFLFLSHWAASIYYSFTRLEGFEPDYTYGPQLGHSNHEGWRPSVVHENGPIIYQYLQSQYYAMALLSGIGRHLYPPTDLDVCLSLFIMLTGVFVVSYLIGKVGHLIFQLNASAAEFKAETTFVQQLLDYRKVPQEVTHRVTEYMRHIWTSQKGIDPNVALRGLPVQIRTDIMMTICEEMIRKVPRFKDLDDGFVRQLVSELSFVELPAGEFVFRQGQIGDSMYFISKGLVEILFDAPKHSATEDVGSPSLAPTQLKIIGEGSFFGEGALFSGTRAASIRARTSVRLLALSEASFQKVMIVHPHFAEKIMYLNAERQKRLDEKAEARMSGVVSRGNSQQNLLPGAGGMRMNISSPDNSPRGPAQSRYRKQSIRPTTGLGNKVQALLAAKEDSIRKMSGKSPTPASGNTGTTAMSVGVSPQGTAVASAVATAGTANSPPAASAATTATSSTPMPSGWGNQGPNPSTLTITTTHTIALQGGGGAASGGGSSTEVHTHAGHHRSPSGRQLNNMITPTHHIISGVEINNGNASSAGNSTPHRPPRSSASSNRRRTATDQERSLHAAVPPGFSDDADDDIPARPAPDHVQPRVINPARASFSANNSGATGGGSGGSRRTSWIQDGPGAGPGLLGYPVSAASLTFGSGFANEGGVGFPGRDRDVQPPPAASVFNAAASSSSSSGDGLGGIGSKSNARRATLKKVNE